MVDNSDMPEALRIEQAPPAECVTIIASSPEQDAPQPVRVTLAPPAVVDPDFNGGADLPPAPEPDLSAEPSAQAESTQPDAAPASEPDGTQEESN